MIFMLLFPGCIIDCLTVGIWRVFDSFAQNMAGIAVSWNSTRSELCAASQQISGSATFAVTRVRGDKPVGPLG